MRSLVILKHVGTNARYRPMRIDADRCRAAALNLPAIRLALVLWVIFNLYCAPTIAISVPWAT